MGDLVNSTRSAGHCMPAKRLRLLVIAIDCCQLLMLTLLLHRNNNLISGHIICSVDTFVPLSILYVSLKIKHALFHYHTEFTYQWCFPMDQSLQVQ